MLWTYLRSLTCPEGIQFSIIFSKYIGLPRLQRKGLGRRIPCMPQITDSQRILSQRESSVQVRWRFFKRHLKFQNTICTQVSNSCPHKYSLSASVQNEMRLKNWLKAVASHEGPLSGSPSLRRQKRPSEDHRRMRCNPWTVRIGCYGRWLTYSFTLWHYSPDGRKPPLIRFHSLIFSVFEEQVNQPDSTTRAIW
jgi:hypothetical protein